MIVLSSIMFGILSITHPAIPPEINDKTPLEMFSIDSDYGAQRCESLNCTCRVSISPFEIESEDYQFPSISRVYFSESSDELSQSQKSEILQYLASHPSERYFTVTGYTDGCGNNNYNYGLSLGRASSVREFIRQNRSGAVVATRGVAELSANHDASARRVDIQSQTTSVRFPAYPEIIADVYLIDASGSMSSTYRSWLSVISNSRPRGSKVYISYTGRCQSGQRALSVRPGGGTEIWYSYWHILDLISSGQTLAIISDFDSQIPLTSSERARISEKVRQKRISVIAITP